MKILSYGKDGGPESTVWGYWLVEIKSWFSIALLCFEDGSREAHHEHAFNCVSWVLRGALEERTISGPVTQQVGGRVVEHDRGFDTCRWLRPSWLPYVTRRRTFHKVTSHGRTWVLTIRGPWADTWRERLASGRLVTLTHGRREISA